MDILLIITKNMFKTWKKTRVTSSTEICFMFNEYHAVFHSLFMQRANYHKYLVEVLCLNPRGLSVSELSFGNKKKGIRYIVSEKGESLKWYF